MREIEQLINLQNEALRAYVHSIYYKRNRLAQDCYIESVSLMLNEIRNIEVVTDFEKIWKQEVTICVLHWLNEMESR